MAYEYEYDYDGEMSYYQRQLAKHGITVEQLDMTNYCGLTARELQGIVNSAIAQVESKRAAQKEEI